ncbi:MAG: GAF domain-containing protein [Rhodothermales bacterium]|nr:GAF domain-containing protein [Rhodothermales bacterium]
MSEHPGVFPFQTVLSFEPLLAFWRHQAEEQSGIAAQIARMVSDAATEIPALLGPIDDIDRLLDHQETVDVLMSAVFPPGLNGRWHAAAIVPFGLQSFYMTPAFASLDLFRHLKRVFQEDFERMMTAKIMMAYAYIMRTIYGITTEIDFPLMAPVIDDATGLVRYFKLDFDTQFCSVKVVGEAPALSRETIDGLMAHRFDLGRWFEALPPAHFAFHGFAIFSAVEVTEGQLLSELKHDLLQKDALATPEKIDRVQQRIRSLLRCPGIEIGLILIEQGDFDRITSIHPLGRSLLLKRGVPPSCDTWQQSFYARASDGRTEPIVIDRLEELAHLTGFEEYLRDQGYHTLVLAPLFSQDRLVGILELGTRSHTHLDPMGASTQLREITALFGVAIHRGLEEREDRIQAVIKEQYTSIHPTVEWRFREAAKNYIDSGREGATARAEEIVFHGVHPLYGLSDIRGSSTERNRAIQSDLAEQLTLADEVLLEVQQHRPMPVLEEIRFRLGQYLAEVEHELRSGEEVTILHFLRSEIEPLFAEFERIVPSSRVQIEGYREALDAELGILYRRRRDYEDSVSRINHTIGAYIERQEEAAQAMYPHYFEMYKTDGVDYNLYVGGSLHQNGRYDPLYLRNLRLWQLMLMCGVEWEMASLKPTLKAPLDIAHLVLVQDFPLSIRFRIDEKQFDVDGAYNIRYEIVKKRIDKARIFGTSERLTQPGYMAIVYSQDGEAVDYARYVRYLLATGYLVGEVEYVQLEDLQGVHGLKALRVRIAPNPVSESSPGPRSSLQHRSAGDGHGAHGALIDLAAIALEAG